MPLSLRRTPVVAVLLSAMLCAPSLHAYHLEGLYEAIVATHGQDDAARLQAFRAALTEVLVKVSADPEVIPSAEALLDEAASFVHRYEYRDAPPPGAEQSTARWLRVQFREQPLLHALGRAGIATWGSERPLTLLWSATDAQDRREFTATTGKDSYSAEILHHAGRLGLPIALPLLDLEDLEKLSAGDLWLGFSSAIRAASERYTPDTILSLCLEQATGEARWTLYTDGAPPQEWRTAGTMRIQQGLEQLAHILADRYGRGLRVDDEESVVPIRITGIRNYEHYLDTLTYLESLETTSRVGVHKLSEQGVEFHVHTFLSHTAIRRAIELGNRLQPLAGTGGEGNRHWYRAR